MAEGRQADPELEQIAHHLEARLEARLQSLQGDLTRIGGLERVAQALEDSGALAQLATKRVALQRRLQELQQLVDDRVLNVPRADTAERPAPAPPAPRQVAACPVSTGKSAAPEPLCAELCAASPAEPAPEVESASNETVAEARTWTPRELSVLEALRESIAASVAGLGDASGDLARFKMYTALFRGAWEERKRHTGAQDAWRDLQAELRERLRRDWPGQSCLPLIELSLTPERWEHLALRYDALAQAHEAVEWLDAVRDEQPAVWMTRDAMPLIEASGAAVTLFYRWLLRHLPAQKEPQQAQLYSHLRAWGADLPLFIRSLQGEDTVGDTELETLAADLAGRRSTLQAGVEKKQRQSAALEALLQAIAEPDWGGQETDPDHLCDLAAACLDAGIPTSDKRLRDPLLEMGWMLEDDPRVVRLYKAVESENQRLERIRQRGKEVDEPGSSGENALPPDVQRMLRRVLEITAGKRGLIVGGHCREDSRKCLEQTLDFAELRWPDLEPSDPFSSSIKDIRKADFVFLTRFNRKKSREAFRVCHEQDKPLICLPKGYGLHEVITRTFYHSTRWDR